MTDPVPIRVLHVEDDSNDAFLIAHAFRKRAPQVNLALVSDGRLAKDYLAGGGDYRDRLMPDLVLMDLKLPKMTGLEVLEWMKSQDGLKGLPVFILSSSSEKRDVDRARELGARGYFPKHGSSSGLAQIVQEIVAFAEALRGTGTRA